MCRNHGLKHTHSHTENAFTQHTLAKPGSPYTEIVINAHAEVKVVRRLDTFSLGGHKYPKATPRGVRVGCVGVGGMIHPVLCVLCSVGRDDSAEITAPQHSIPYRWHQT